MTTSSPRRVRITAGVAAAAATLLMGSQAVAAQERVAEVPVVDRHTIATPLSAAASQSWSAERMEAAVPRDLPETGGQVTTEVAVGDPLVILGETAEPEVRAELLEEAALDAGIASETPVSHIGKVFFTIAGVDYVCSANSVVSDNDATVATAGHCLNDGAGTFASDFIFVPAYDNGQAPYGQWPAVDLITASAWSQQEDINYDIGFAVVSSSDGASLTEAVGASGVAFNQPRGQSYTAYGYPAGFPFDGETLETCAGVAQNDTFGGTQSIGIPCDMTGGSSGGPWLLGSGPTGVQNSVNSFGYHALPDVMFGPYWGEVAEAVYAAAQE
ncbi:trypsin-like serine peptidase [Bogoriella caseilytica]|uniref:V8-like Glu-specific endopeptidase n=1 Tax=Bogoriella caseilytica TaxID=56055 RepID=A0A3N2BB53_9MICO|nr:hypothetical protein [Bogoriella caseilytica]ROR72475.1 V8-like Glu-specific endopeptidase [Bogoriella caseilytica]